MFLSEHFISPTRRYWESKGSSVLGKITVLSPLRVEQHQFFREWFADACERIGIGRHHDFFIPWGLRLIIGKLGLCFPFYRRERMLVLSGGRPEYFAWPWCYFYEIVPVVWDCWPKYREHLIRFVRRNRVRTIFCTSSQTAKYVNDQCPNVDAVWLPEGVDDKLYPLGPRLVDRSIDILEMGRLMTGVHCAIKDGDFGRKLNHAYSDCGLLFPDFASLTEGMRNSKISICYPRCDTHPEMAGNVETMTQRYWEFMLSGTLIAGRAPEELIRFCGYNPVIELGQDPASDLRQVLDHIEDYQALADRNRRFAERYASWDGRMQIVLDHLNLKNLECNEK